MAALAPPCAMDSVEAMDTDEPWTDKSLHADEPTGSGLTPPVTEFVPVLFRYGPRSCDFFEAGGRGHELLRTYQEIKG